MKYIRWTAFYIILFVFVVFVTLHFTGRNVFEVFDINNIKIKKQNDIRLEQIKPIAVEEKELEPLHALPDSINSENVDETDD